MSEQEVFDALKYRVEIDEDGSRRNYNTNGELHRTDGPAVEWAVGEKRWYQNGLLHRTNGPAVIRAGGGKEWWQNGLLHRENGPAAEWADGRKSWHINGKVLSEAEFLAATQPVVEMTVADIEKLLGKRVKIIK